MAKRVLGASVFNINSQRSPDIEEHFQCEGKTHTHRQTHTYTHTHVYTQRELRKEVYREQKTSSSTTKTLQDSQNVKRRYYMKRGRDINKNRKREKVGGGNETGRGRRGGEVVIIKGQERPWKFEI